MMTSQERGASKGSASFNLLSNDDVSAVRAWNCASHNQQVLFYVNPHYAQILASHVVLTHVTCSPHSFENTRRKR